MIHILDLSREKVAGRTRFIRDSLLGLALAVFIVLPSPAPAASVALSTSPLANATTTSVLPNIMFTLDNSGSMAWDFLPDWVNDSYGRSSYPELFKNADFNGVYYNPAVTYSPPIMYTSGGTLDTTTYPSIGSPWTAVRYDQFGKQSAADGSNATNSPVLLCPNGDTPSPTSNTSSTTSTCNLVGGADYYTFVPGEYCTQQDLKTCVPATATSTTYPYPATLRWCSNTALTTCQITRTDTYKYPRYAGMPSTATVKVTNSTAANTVSQISINGQKIMSGAAAGSSTESTTATNIAGKINDCTTAITGGCTVAGYRASTSGTTVTITSPDGSGAITYTPSVTGGATTSVTAFINGVPGSRIYVDIVSTNNSYPYPGTTAKALTRTDCSGATCTYAQEMTNFANWFAYYHTRMQSMKSAVGRAFKDIDSKFRVGFNAISYTGSTDGSTFLHIDTFNASQKNSWYTKLYGSDPTSSTPLRTSLAKVGKIFAHQLSGAADPVQYSCQQNFSILSTDGYWNDSGTSFSLTGSSVGNMDGGTTPRPMKEGTTATTDSLADVAKYYYDTDLRTPGLSNCTGSIRPDGSSGDVCENNVFVSSTDNNVKQHITTFTMGLGADGLLNYQEDYETATSGDYYNLKNGLGSPTVNWPEPVSGKASTIDDLWHAAVNGRGRYFSAKNPDDIVAGFNKALASITSKIGAGAAAATSTLNPVSGDNSAYVASYTTVKWMGNLEARAININTGVTSETASWCVEDVVGGTCSAPSALQNDTSGGSNVWYCVTPSQTTCPGGTLVGTDCKVEVPKTCTGQLKTQVSDTSDSRTIKMKIGASLADFTYANIGTAGLAANFSSGFLGTNLSQWPTLTAAQQTLAAGNNLVKFLRGQTGYEDRTSNTDKLYRAREATLGDVVEAQPAFLGKPTFSYTDTGYSAFVTANASRAKTVFLGANDGMLHAIDATSGLERWAYVPSKVIPNMWKLADKNYATMHTYYVNGSPVISDIYAGGVWKTILIGSLRGGGRGYYALDVTNPASPTLLWEFTAGATGASDPGYSFGDAVVTKMSDGTWVALVTSGYNNTSTGDGKGYLYVLNANTGAIIKTISTGVGDTTTPSGLSKIAVWADSPEIDNTAGNVYGGDLLGNLWRFDINAGTAMKFAVLKDAAGNVQPITTRPDLARVSDKPVVYVATGKYLETGDLTDTQLQTLYAIKDDSATVTFTNPRLATTGVDKMVQNTLTTSGATRTVAVGSAVDFTSGRGWYINFPDSGERATVDPMLYWGTLLVPTTVPSNTVCAPGGYGWLNYVDYKTGGQVAGSSPNLAGQKTNAPIVGMNVITLPNGQVVVSVVTADHPTPEIVPGVGFANKGGGFVGQRVIWRELVQ